MPIIRQGSNYERVDLKAKKDDISQILGDDADSYWNTFRDFITAKLSKTEFDIAARRILGKNSMQLFFIFLK